MFQSPKHPYTCDGDLELLVHSCTRNKKASEHHHDEALTLICHSLESTQQFFTEALETFAKELSNDEAKSKWIVDIKEGNLGSVLKTVEDARFQYEARKGDSKVREKLVEFSEKIHYYGGIMDVLASCHPGK